MIHLLRITVVGIALANAAFDVLVSVPDWYFWELNHHLVSMLAIGFIYAIAASGLLGAAVICVMAKRINAWLTGLV